MFSHPLPKKTKLQKSLLVGGFNPLEKYARQNGNLPQLGMKIPKYLSCHHLVLKRSSPCLQAMQWSLGEDQWIGCLPPGIEKCVKQNPFQPKLNKMFQNVNKKKHRITRSASRNVYVVLCKTSCTIDMNDIDMTWHPQRRIFTPRRQRQSRNFPKGSHSPGGRLQLHWASRENSPEVFSKKTVKGVHSRNLTNWYPNCLPCIEGQLPFPNHPFGYPS